MLFRLRWHFECPNVSIDIKTRKGVDIVQKFTSSIFQECEFNIEDLVMELRVGRNT